MRGFPREAFVQGPKDSSDFPKVREGKGLEGRDLAAGLGSCWTVLNLCPQFLLCTSGGSVLEMGERSPVMSPI